MRSRASARREAISVKVIGPNESLCHKDAGVARSRASNFSVSLLSRSRSDDPKPRTTSVSVFRRAGNLFLRSLGPRAIVFWFEHRYGRQPTSGLLRYRSGNGADVHSTSSCSLRAIRISSSMGAMGVRIPPEMAQVILSCASSIGLRESPQASRQN